MNRIGGRSVGLVVERVWCPPRARTEAKVACCHYAAQVGLQPALKQGSAGTDVPPNRTAQQEADSANMLYGADGSSELDRRTLCAPASEGKVVVPKEDEEYAAALRRGLRLFAVYVDAGGSLCMRPTIWRKLMVALHPDRGGNVRVFQHINALKRRLDAGETIELLPAAPVLAASKRSEADSEAGALEERLREELRATAAPHGDHL